MAEKKPNRRCCSCSGLLSLAISVTLIILTYRIVAPKCSIVEFDAFALQKATTNQSIHYDLKLRNRDVYKGIYYDALNVTVFYKPNLSSFLIGDAITQPFYQGRGKTAHIVGNIETTKGVNLGNASGGAEFRVQLATAVRYKSLLWKTKRHRLVLGGDVKVNAQGSLVDGVVLSSRATRTRGSVQLIGIMGIFGLLYFF